MDDYILRLTPKPLKGAAPPQGVQLTLSPEESGPDESGEACVFSSFPYSGALAGARLDQVERISAFYVNGIRLRIAEEPAGDALPFQFTDRRTGDRIFNDTFGYVRFTVELREKDGAEAALHSGLIPVYVNPDDQETHRACACLAQMADFVYDHCEPFWREDQLPAEGVDKTPSLAPSALKQAGRRTLAAHIQLLNAIILAYEKSLPFFRTGSKYRVRPEKQWVDFERAAHLNSATFHSILQRPCYLMPAGQGGVRLPGREDAYIPAKVVADAGQVNYDIYENQYVLGFLRCLLDTAAATSASLDALLRTARKPDAPVNGYVNSVYFLCGSTQERLRSGQQALKLARRRLSGLYAAYQRLLPTAPAQVRGAPKGTAIFRSVHYYRNLYDLACQWFQFGVYNFQREEFLLPFVAGHKLYEYYVLIKLLRRLEQEEGFTLTGRRTASWKRTGAGAFVVSLSTAGRPNVFLFQREDVQAAVFYEPKLYSLPSELQSEAELSAQGLDQFRLGLFRNNSFNLPGGEEEGDALETAKKRRDSDQMYTPDYVVRFQQGDGPARYIVLDAKFADLAAAQTFHMPALGYKYLYSLSPVHPEDQILGLCLLYGKPDGTGAAQPAVSGYDQAGGREIRPFSRFIALRPENESVHPDALAQALPLHDSGR